MKEHYVNSLNNFIGGWYIDDMLLCDEIVEFHTTAPQVSAGKVNGKVNTDAKESVDTLLDLSPDLYNKYCVVLGQVLDFYSKKFGPFVQECAEFNLYEAINIQYYPPGGGYKQWHTERDNGRAPFRNRYLTFMTYLNDVNDNGETEFYYQQLKIKPEKGLTLMWGTDWTFTHRGIPSETQQKYIATGWLSFKG